MRANARLQAPASAAKDTSARAVPREAWTGHPTLVAHNVGSVRIIPATPASPDVSPVDLPAAGEPEAEIVDQPLRDAHTGHGDTH